VPILTIDDEPYTFWSLTTTNPTVFFWEIGSQHTVVASTPLTGWDGVTHAFSSWTNGNGLGIPSGTFIVPTSDVTVTANYS